MSLIRNVKGLLGRYYDVRYALGHYRSACVTATYRTTLRNNAPSQMHLSDILEHCVQATVQQHPGLCYGRASDEPGFPSPAFVQIRTICRDDVVEYVDGNKSSTPDDSLRQYLEAAHASLWPANKPSWKVIICQHERESTNTPTPSSVRVDIAFLAHHAIADGLSGAAFHRAMMANFETASKATSCPEWPLVLTDARPVPSLVDDFIDFSAFAAVRDPDTGKHVWAGNPVSLPSVDEVHSKIRLVSISAERLSSMLQSCKRMRVSLTGVLHGLICASLARSLCDAPAFRAVTPYSLRAFTHASLQDIVNHICYMTKYIPRDWLQDLRASARQSLQEHDQIMKLAREFNSDMAAEMLRFPRGSAWASLDRVEDLEAYCRDQEGKQRDYTYELSNLGSQASLNCSSIALDRLIFTQCGMVAGPAIGLNCVSVQGGAFTIAITWQHGIVDVSLVESLAHDLENCFGEGFAWSTSESAMGT